MRKPLLLAALCMLGVLALAPAAFAQNTLNCKDFPSQAAAQANLIQNPGDPNRLDANNNGIACEDYPYATGTPTNMTPVAPNQTTPAATTTPATHTSTTATTPAASAQTVASVADTTATPTAGALPSSGGPVILIPAAALLLGSGLVALGLVRRNS